MPHGIFKANDPQNDGASSHMYDPSEARACIECVSVAQYMGARHSARNSSQLFAIGYKLHVFEYASLRVFATDEEVTQHLSMMERQPYYTTVKAVLHRNHRKAIDLETHKELVGLNYQSKWDAGVYAPRLVLYHKSPLHRCHWRCEFKTWCCIICYRPQYIRMLHTSVYKDTQACDKYSWHKRSDMFRHLQTACIV